MRSIFLSSMACLAVAASVVGAETPKVFRHYRVNAKVFSLGADRNVESYQSHGGGWGSVGATLGHDVPAADEAVRIDIQLERRSGRLIAECTIKPKNGGSEDKRTIDLTDLRATSLQIAEDSDGRTYEVNLTPSIVEARLEAKPFRQATKDLYRLRFHDSRVLLNDEQYIGRMLASDAEVLTLDICDLATIEFSLHRLKDAQAWGTLQDGRIAITHPDGTMIEIMGVTNGTDDRLISGGPYQVWVRWNKPSTTARAYRQSIADFRERLAADTKNAGLELQARLEQLDKELARQPGPWVVGCSARGLNPRDLVRDAD